MSVLVVDDDEDRRRLARSVLTTDGLDVVGEAATGAEAVRKAARLHPVCVLLDLRLPDVDGLVVAEQLAELDDPPAVVLTSSRAAVDWGPRLHRVPSRGFLPKAELSGAALQRLLASD